MQKHASPQSISKAELYVALLLAPSAKKGCYYMNRIINEIYYWLEFMIILQYDRFPAGQLLIVLKIVFP